MPDNDKSFEVFICVVLVIVGLCIGMAIGSIATRHTVELEAIEHGAMKYHEETGETYWIDHSKAEEDGR